MFKILQSSHPWWQLYTPPVQSEPSLIKTKKNKLNEKCPNFWLALHVSDIKITSWYEAVCICVRARRARPHHSFTGNHLSAEKSLCCHATCCGCGHRWDGTKSWQQQQKQQTGRKQRAGRLNMQAARPVQKHTADFYLLQKRMRSWISLYSHPSL